MAKKVMRVVVTGKPRPAIDVNAMTQVVIALGRELTTKNAKSSTKPVETEVAVA